MCDPFLFSLVHLFFKNNLPLIQELTLTMLTCYLVMHLPLPTAGDHLQSHLENILRGL